MKKIIGERNSGRSTDLICMSAKYGYYIVCAERQRAICLQQVATELGLKIPFPITYKEFLEHKYAGKNILGFLIDDAEQFLQSLTVVPIEAIVLNKAPNFGMKFIIE